MKMSRSTIVLIVVTIIVIILILMMLRKPKPIEPSPEPSFDSPECFSDSNCGPGLSCINGSCVSTCSPCSLEVKSDIPIPDPVNPWYFALNYAQQSDGKIVYSDGNYLKRANADGTPDLTFGTAGSTVNLISYHGLSCTSGGFSQLLVHSDDSIFVSTVACPSGPGRMAVMKLTSNGAVDTSYGTNGAAYSTTNESPLAFGYLLPNGGWIANASTGIMKFTPGGQLDTSFATNGVATIGVEIAPVGFNTFDWITIYTLPTGKILVVGIFKFPGNIGELCSLRLNADGTLDTSYGSSGVGQISRSFLSPGTTCWTNTFDAESVVLPDGSVVICTIGAYDIVSAPDSCDDWPLMILKLTPGGQIDTSFGVDGIFYYLPQQFSFVVGRAIFATPCGGFAVFANDYLNNGDLHVLKLTPYGQLDPSWSIEVHPDEDTNVGRLLPNGDISLMVRDSTTNLSRRIVTRSCGL